MSPANPLLDFSGLPRFHDFDPQWVSDALDTLLAQNRQLIESLGQAGQPAYWEQFVAPMQDANERLRRAWGQVAHLNAVLNSPALREAYNANLPRVTRYFTELSQNAALFSKYKALHASESFSRMPRARRKLIENELRDFRLGGAELDAQGQLRFAQVSEKLAELSSKFNDNLLDATNAFSYLVTDPAVLNGVPPDVVAAAAEAARQAGLSGWKLTLHMPCYLPVMQYAENRELRQTLYRAYAIRASEFGDPRWDNSPVIREILILRKEQAKLLGFANFAEFSLQPKMAKTPQQVVDFLESLAARAKPYAERDLAELAGLAAGPLGLGKLEPWDVAFVSEKLRAQRYAFSDQQLRQYFPEDVVLAGMFRVVQVLYGLLVEADRAATWHPDVRFFTLRDADGRVVGQFYLDLYARPSKRGGAWMDDAISRRRVAQGIQTPVAYLNCNFSAPGSEGPATFTHDEVITLFHEFGHGLHHLLTQVEEFGVSGIHGVEWDAIELPSQFMENYCWEWDVLHDMTRHVASGETLPRDLFDRMIAAKNFQSGMQTVRQLEFAMFDMHLHFDHDPSGARSPLDLLSDVRRKVAVLFPPDYHRFPNGFSHVFGGGYAAGYYSYKWAEVLSADAYSLFEETGILNTRTGQRFRKEVLGSGGSRPAMESFIAFRGREPTLDALLRHHGMTDAVASS